MKKIKSLTFVALMLILSIRLSAQDVVFENGTYNFEDTIFNIDGSLIIRNANITFYGCTININCTYDQEFDVEIWGNSIVDIDSTIIQGTEYQTDFQVRAENGYNPQVTVQNSSRCLMHAGFDFFNNSTCDVYNSEIGEVQAHDTAYIYFENASAYLVLFFPQGTYSVDSLYPDSSITNTISLTDKWTVEIVNSYIDGYQFDLYTGTTLNASNCEAVVLSIHTPGNLSQIASVSNLTIEGDITSGSLTELGPVFNYTDCEIPYLNIYVNGTDTVELTSLHVNESEVHNKSVLYIGNPGDTTKCEFNLMQSDGRGQIHLDNVIVTLPTDGFNGSVLSSDTSHIFFENMDLTGLFITTQHYGRVCFTNCTNQDSATITHFEEGMINCDLFEQDTIPDTTNTYFVSLAGDDSNPGTYSLPWRTVQYACDNATPGNTVYIRQGTYNEKVSVNVSGSAGNYITFRNYQNEDAILDGTGIDTVNNLFEIYGQQYIKVIGLQIKNSFVNEGAGLIIEHGSHHIEIRNNKISNIYFSSSPSDPVSDTTNANPLVVLGDLETASCNNIIIDSNEVFDCRPGFSEALTLDGNVEQFEITNNYVHDITNIGIDMAGNYGICSNPLLDQTRNGICKKNRTYNCKSPYATAAGIYVDGGKDIVVENNIVNECQWGIEVGCEIIGSSTSNITVRNNLIYNNDASGIAFGGYDYPAGSGKVTNSKILNNTCFNNDTSMTLSGEMTLNYSENCTINNNIFYSNVSDKLFSLLFAPVGLNLDYNLWYCPGGSSVAEVTWNSTNYTGYSNYTTSTGQDVHSVFGNPLLISATLPTPDLHIQSSSPAINSGDPVFIADSSETDIDGEARINQGRVDIGADEFFYPTMIVNTIIETNNNVILYPNPAKNEIIIETLQNTKTNGMTCEILNTEGQIIRKLYLKNQKTKIDIRELNSGFYIIKVKSENGITSKKLVKR